MQARLLEQARQRAGLTQEELARLGGTSRPTLSAYESGRKSPTLATAARILEVAGFAIGLESKINFRQVVPARGRPFFVADGLWRLSARDAMATVALPLSLNWSEPDRTFDLRDRHDRARCYEIVLREGKPDDFTRFVDGVLLVDMWPELVLPRAIKSTWMSLIEEISR